MFRATKLSKNHSANQPRTQIANDNFQFTSSYLPPMEPGPCGKQRLMEGSGSGPDHRRPLLSIGKE